MAIIDRVTPSVLKATATMVTATAKRAGVPDTDRWALRAGSVTYGRCWLLVSVDPETGGQGIVATLGTTRNEAYQALTAMGDAFRMFPTV
mgnify:CR=1 FL=1